MLKLVINKEYREPIKRFVSKLPSSFDNGGEVIEDGRNIIKAIDFEGLKLNVKMFKTPHLVNQYVYAKFRDSKAKRSYEYAKILSEKGLNTPTPLAYIEERKSGRLKNSIYISIHEQFDGEVRVMYRGSLEEHRELIEAFAKYTGMLHNRGVLHLDYSSGNVLFKKKDNKYEFYLVDLNRIKFGQSIGIKETSRNFRRLWGNDEMLIYFAEHYAIYRQLNVREMVKATMEERNKFWKKHQRKYPGAAPYAG